MCVGDSCGVEEALRGAKRVSQVTLVCHSSLIDHPVWNPFGRHPDTHAAVRIQDHGRGLRTLPRARPKSEITVWNCLLVRFWNAFWTTFGPQVGHFSIKCDPVFSVSLWNQIRTNIASSHNKNVDFASYQMCCKHKQAWTDSILQPFHEKPFQ